MLSDTDDKTLKEIHDNLAERMSTHINSMCATDDEVRIAWLLCHVDDLNEKIEKLQRLNDKFKDQVHDTWRRAVKAETPNVPKPPEPPPLIRIKEGCGHFCPKCGSSMVRKNWFGSRECFNGCRIDL